MARGTAPGPGALGSIRQVDDGSDIIDWVHFEKSRAELGPGFIRILSYFREDGAKSLAAIEQAMHEQNTVALVIPAHTLKGEVAPVRRRAAGRGGREDRADRALSASKPTASPTSWSPTWSSFAGCGTGRSSCSTRRPTRCRAAHRSPAASAARSPTRASGGFRPRAAPAGSSASAAMLPRAQAAPQPFERAVVEPVEPRLRPGQHQHPHGDDHQPQLRAAELAEQAEAPAVEQAGHQDRRAEIVGEGGAAGGGDAILSQPPSRVSRMISAAIAATMTGRISTVAAIEKANRAGTLKPLAEDQPDEQQVDREWRLRSRRWRRADTARPSTGRSESRI